MAIRSTVLAIASYSTFIVVMTTVVMGDTCVQSITAIHTTIRLLCWYNSEPEAICFCHFVVAMAMVVMGGMCVQSVTAVRTIIRLLCWK